MNRATQYAQDVVDGKIIANDYVWGSCQRHLDDLARTDIYFDEEVANRAYRFFEKILKLNGGQFEGKPFVLHPSQAFIVGSLFGWKRLDGTRRFRRAYMEISKGNGKSPLAAGLGLYGMIGDQESRAEIYAAASKRDQAMVLFRDARAMVQMSPELARICRVSGGDHTPNIAFIKAASFFRPISSDKGQSGPRPHMAICDEVHEHHDRETMEMLERGFKFREQPMLIMITNSGFDKTSVCYEEHCHAVKVAQGDIEDDTTFSFVCGLDEGDDPLENEDCWQKANPLLDVTITRQYLRDVVKQAKDMPGKRNNILRLHFCVWTDAASVWMGRELWEACEVENLEPNLSLPCYGGVDLSARQDLTAVARVWQCPDGSYDAIVDFWTPKETLRARADRDRAPYLEWKRDGYIRTTPGASVDYRHIAPVLAGFLADSEFTQVGFDRWRFDLMENALDDIGVTLPLVKFGQGYQDMGPAVEILENLIYNKRLRVRFNPCLRWNVACTVAIQDAAGSRKFDKSKSTGRIDGVVALAMALRLAEKDDVVNIDEFLNKPLRLG